MTAIDLRRLSLAAAVLAATAWIGCGAPLTCGPGTKLDGGLCLPVPAAPSVDAGPVDGGRIDGGPVDGGAGDAGACLPNCVGRHCGSDGCGGSCGSCNSAAAPACNTILGVCAASCTPACAGRDCGDDGCGGSCGGCTGGAACNSAGVCVPAAWTCPAAEYDAHDYCHCGCGAPDPDCASDAGLPVVGCGPQQGCGPAGTCVSDVPAGWTCPAAEYASGEYCYCNCGAPDPDCQNPRLDVIGCPGTHPACTASGTCAVCTPDCTGKVCGDDGCGGSCGSCAADGGDNVCRNGVCGTDCSPTPIACEVNVCGDDGCGGSCGSCASDQTCTAGQCITNLPQGGPTSCVGHCGGQATGGCLCTATCTDAGTCCADYATACVCTPSCQGVSCGPDGCGGSCGSCPSGQACNGGQCGACAPSCQGLSCGPDGCGGSCGSCAAGSTCAWTQQCVPNDWICDPSDYASGLACSCGCGAPDPDCTSSGLPLLGCPAGVTACTSGGLCQVTFCSSNAACSGGDWCTGVYDEGGGRFGGACAVPVTDALGEGQPCSFDSACESGVCLGSMCRSYCAKDSDCGAGEICDGQGVVGGSGGPVEGFAAVCDPVPQSTGACTSQASCGNETCIAVVDATTLAPRYVCAETPGMGTIGASCALAPCPQGQLCASSSTGPVCTLPCPGGAADCPSGWSCGSIPFSSATLLPPAQAAQVPACVR